MGYSIHPVQVVGRYAFNFSAIEQDDLITGWFRLLIATTLVFGQSVGSDHDLDQRPDFDGR